MSKDVYLDVTFLAFGKDLRGIPQVISQLVRLFRQDPVFRDVRYISTPEVTRYFLEPWGVPSELIAHVRPIPWLGRFERFHGLFSTIRYRDVAARAGLIIHAELRSVLRSVLPQMILHYDFIIFERFANHEPRKWMRYLHYLHKNRVAAKARFKVAISEFTRHRALELFPAIDPYSITSRLIGIRMRPAGAPRQAPGPGDTVRFLYVGSFEARKNIPALLAHLALVGGDRHCRLHLAGKIGPQQEAELKALSSSLPPQVQVLFHGLVSETELAGLYRQSDFFLFPSLFEGFGLTVIEAMAQGVPVCAFRNSSLPEIGGDAALLADDGDFRAWGRAVAGLLASAEAYRAASVRSLARAAEFTEAKMHQRYREYFLAAFRDAGIPAAKGIGA